MSAEPESRRYNVEPVKVYIASKSDHSLAWQELRGVWRERLDPRINVISTWIDEGGPGESTSLTDLWRRCITEASTADVLIAFYFSGEQWKGAYVEIGAALAHGVPVYVCGRPPGSWINHPLVTLASDPDDALGDFLTFKIGVGRE